ncbi:MAG: DoxX family protein [Acetobacteraceae bacterium]|nr:DoxX family protein [Acetobacteraceae bacterium]
MRSQPQNLVLATEQTTTEKDRYLAVIARLCLVLLFPFSCLSKIFDYQSAMAQAAHGWIPLPPATATLLLVLGGILEAVGPLCILFGFYRRQAALLFIFYVIATAVLFHNFWDFPFNGEMWNNNFWPFLKNLGLAGGFLYIAADAKMESLRGAFSLSPR